MCLFTTKSAAPKWKYFEFFTFLNVVEMSMILKGVWCFNLIFIFYFFFLSTYNTFT